MVSDIISKLQDTSYTNKDFGSIYPELLDLVRALTYKWDPSISNESDPGVILIKLNALIADKCNYNSDKNVLECFPLSVTQDQNARQLFSQLGYYMHWYKSATTDVTLRWRGIKGSSVYTIPAFTMVSDSEKKVIYSLIGPSSGPSSDSFVVADQNLYMDSSAPCVFKAIQGLSVNYSINGDTLITANYLDENNRLYFDSTDIAQNGIFITNANARNYSSWIRKDNLEVESLNNTYYKFGVTEDGTSCYIEFPKDVEYLFRNGINITYIRTLGDEGNISAKYLDSFYNDILVTDVTGSTFTLSSDNVYITNVNSAVNGLDVEDIDHAYAGYQKTIGTFNTLVTLRDYINHIYNSKLVSNDFVCDRTNDIQSCYNIMSAVNGLDSEVTQVDSVGGTVDLTAFSLKLYLLNYVEDVTQYVDFAKTFDLILNSSQIDSIKSYIEDIKSIQHDYVDIKDRNATRSNFCLFKNRYPISCTIIPKYELTTDEIQSVKNNIKVSLHSLLQARNMNFGEGVNFSEVYNCILSSDQRIKQVSLDNINYDIYGVYSSDGNLYEVNLNDDNLFDIDAPQNLTATVDRATFQSKRLNDYSTMSFTYNGSTWSPSIADYGVTVTGTPVSSDVIKVTPTAILQFRDEIYVKSVLAGRTQLFVSDEDFKYSLDQFKTLDQESVSYATVNPYTVDNIQSISTDVQIHLTEAAPQYDLRNNEMIQFYAPNLLEGSTYSNGVKYQYKVDNDIAANTSYKLQTGEYVIVYWKDVNSSSALYNYYTYGEGNIITPTFALISDPTYTPVGDPEVTSNLINVGTTDSPIMQRWTTDDTPMSTSLFRQVSALVDPYILSGSAKISIKSVNTLQLDNSYLFYWILNSQRDGKYILFEQGTTETSRMLNVGEYIFYTNSDFSDLVILGAGTTVNITDTTVEYSVIAKDSSLIFEDGLSYISSYLFSLNPQQYIKVIENQYINVPPTGSIRFNGLSQDVVIDHTGIDVSDYSIQYRNTPTSAWVDLSSIQLDEGSGWNCKSLLGLNISLDTEQILLSGQTLTCTCRNSDVVEISGYDKNNDLYPVTLKSKSNLIFNGAEELNVQYYEDDILKDNTLYVYGKKVSTSSIDYTSDGNMIVKFSPSAQVQTTSIQFNVPEGDYILTLDNNYKNTSITSTALKLNGSKVPYVYEQTADATRDAFPDKGTYHYRLSIPNKNTQTLAISCKNISTDDIFLSFHRIYKYTMPEHFYKLANYDSSKASVMFSNIQNMLTQFDPLHRYDYEYQVNSETAIDEPILPSSFLLPNHIYNKFVICQMNKLNDAQIKVVSR